RLKPSFNETYHGYKTFSALLEDAAELGLLQLETDERSGTYVVTHFGEEKSGGGSGGGDSGRGPRRRNRDQRPLRGPRRPDVSSRDVDEPLESAHEAPLDRGPENGNEDNGPDNDSNGDSDTRRRRGRRRRGPAESERSGAPIDPKLPPETFDDEFLPWPEE
ncbi:MAG: hypothetical protein NT069_02000, partial [Planctomycetota bacterium]|nr:hypothetical protein [Planctomycetota bacterium]